jgi:hypothetical protein
MTDITELQDYLAFLYLTWDMFQIEFHKTYKLSNFSQTETSADYLRRWRNKYHLEIKKVEYALRVQTERLYY